MNFGEHLYNLRKERNISQGELADALDVSRQSVSKWENNLSTPELDKIIKMSELFNISIDELLTGKSTSFEDSQRASEPISPKNRISKRTKNTISLILLCAGAVILTLATIFIGFFPALSISLPFIICAAICFFGKQDLLLRCGWVVFIFLHFYLFDATGVTESMVVLTFTGMIANPWHIIMSWIMLAAMIAMAVITLFVCFKRPVTVKSKHIILYLCLFALFDIILPIITQTLLARVFADNVLLYGTYNKIIYLCNQGEYIFSVVFLCYLARIIYPKIT